MSVVHHDVAFDRVVTECACGSAFAYLAETRPGTGADLEVYAGMLYAHKCGRSYRFSVVGPHRLEFVAVRP